MSNDQSIQNKEAAWWMLSAVVLFSVTPLLFYVGDAGAAVFLFNAVFQGAAAVASFVTLMLYGKKNGFFGTEWGKQRKWIKVSGKNLFRPDILWACVGSIGYIVFAWSLKYVDISVAAILIETWPTLVILLTGYLFKERYKKIGMNKWLLIGIAFIGMAMVTLSQTEKSEENFLSLVSNTPITGIFLVLLAALLGGLLAPFSLRWGSQVSHEATKTGGSKEEMFFVIVAVIIVRIFGFAIAALGFIVAAPLDLSWGGTLATGGFVAALFCGVFTGAGEIIFRYANTLTNNLGINAFVYATPMVALAWLFIVGFFIDGFLIVPQPDYLVIGCIAIIMANVLISYEADVRTGYKAVMISLWAFGMIVYFRGEVVQFTNYYEAMAIVATVFILILSFRTERMIRRTTHEDALFLSLWHLIPTLISGERRIKHARAVLLRLDTTTSGVKREEAYNKMRKFIGFDSAVADEAALADAATKSDSAMADALTKLDTLTHSKQQGRSFAEKIALGIPAFLTVWGLLAFAPFNITGYVGFYINMSSFLLASTVSFLYFNVYDLERDRHRKTMHRREFNFRSTEDRKFERGLSMFACGAVILAYALLFWYYGNSQ